MPCTNETFGGNRDPKRWENFTKTISYNVSSYFYPNDLGDLCWILKQAEVENVRVKVVGSGWSIEDIAVSQNWVVDISRLNNKLSWLINDDPKLLIESRRLAHLDPTMEKYFHVQAGIKIIDLNKELERENLSMLTLGGAQGQLLAGAISTSTHGSNWAYPPLCDLVQAIHMVTIGGKEVWIESSRYPLTENDNQLKTNLCSDIEIIRDDALLNSVMVGIGRFGVIYSMVIKASTKFRLSAWSQKLNWSNVRTALLAGVGKPGKSAFQELEKYLMSPPASLDISVNYKNYRYLDITLNPRSKDSCWISQHWETKNNVDINLDQPPNPLCHHGVANAVLALAVLGLNAYAGVVALIPIYGIVKSIEILARAASLSVMSLNPLIKGGEAISAAANAVWDSQIGNELSQLMVQINQTTIDSIFQDSSVDGKRGSNWMISSGKTESAFDPSCFNGTSIEIVFDFSKGNFISFIDFILQEGNKYLAVGYVSIRFSQRSTALLSMHNVKHDLAISIEVTSLHGLKDADTWLNLLEGKGRMLGGRPHWGQKNSLDASAVKTLYGENLSKWGTQLNRIVGYSNTYSNNYTNQRGLEPGPTWVPPISNERIVTSIKRQGGKVTHLCNTNETWSPIRIEDALLDNFQYFTKSSEGKRNYLARQRHITTNPDGLKSNNLMGLPIAKTIYPPAIPGGGEITSIILEYRNGDVNPWDRWVEFYCNDKEMWSVHRDQMYKELIDGSQYYVNSTTGGANERQLRVREYFSTYPNKFKDDNLEALPES